MALCCHNKLVLLLKGGKVETNSTDMIYGHMIIPRNTKFEITTVRNTWYHYYEDRHYLRSFVQWPMKGATRDGMSNHVTKLTQLFHGERLRVQSGENKRLQSPWKENYRLKFKEKLSNDERE